MDLEYRTLISGPVTLSQQAVANLALLSRK